jgi:hypothetical protein
MPITVGPFCLTHPVNFPCGRKPEYPEETEENVFGRLISSLKMQVKAGCLCKKVKRWFDDTEGSGIS